LEALLFFIILTIISITNTPKTTKKAISPISKTVKKNAEKIENTNESYIDITYVIS